MAKSRAQQAAIAISMKRAGKKPKQMQKGGKAKTLSTVSKQLAKASKMHAAQSKKVGRLAKMMQEGGYPKSDPNVFMKSMGYYQGGGLATTPMYGSNTIPGTPETSSIVYTEADPAKLKQLEQELEEARESTKYMEEAERNIAEQQAKIQSVERSIGTATEIAKESGLLDKLKGTLAKRATQKAAEEAAKQAGTVIGTTTTQAAASQVAPGALRTIAPKAVTGLQTAGMQAAREGTVEMAKATLPGATTSAAASGIGVPTLGTVAAIGGEVLKQASSDQDETTMNVGETAGTVVSGAGKGIGAALTAGALLGTSVGPIGTVAGAILGAGYGLGKGLIQRNKARKEMEKAEREKEAAIRKASSKQKLEALKSREYSGFDFGADLRQKGGFSKKLDALQDSLTVGGIFPVLGAVPDLINTGISGGRAVYNYATGDTTAAKKNLGNASLSLVSAVPFYGDAISLPRVASKGIKYLSKAKKGKAAANLMPEGGDFQPYSDMNQAFVTESTAVRPGVSYSQLMNMPRFPEQPAMPKVSQKQTGGVKLPGGVAKPIPGSDAIEFKGRSHAQGGIMVDPNTEVEGNETMDKVTMKNGGKSDYFFSQHLKMGGKSFAQRHKDILKNGGRQKDIDALAKLQEKKAGRNPNTVKLGSGGYYQEGGPDDIMATVEIPEVEPVFLRTIPTIDPMAIPTELETIPEDQIYLQDSDKDKDTNSKKLKRVSRKDLLTTAAQLGQLVPAAAAYFSKPDYMDEPAAVGDIKAQRLERVSFNAERAANAANARAMNRFIETSGAGPAGIIAKMSAYRRKQEGDINIAAQEARINTQIANEEARLRQQADAQNQQIKLQNIKNTMFADEFNRAADAAVEDRKLMALDNAFKALGTMNTDRLQYLAQERLGRAIEGQTGVLTREQIGTMVKDSYGLVPGSAEHKEKTNELYLQMLENQKKSQNRLGGVRKYI